MTNQPFENDATIEDMNDQGWLPDGNDKVDIGVGRKKYKGTVARKERVSACGQPDLVKIKMDGLAPDLLRLVAGAPVLIHGTGHLAAIVLCAKDQFLFVQPVKKVFDAHKVQLVKTRKFAGACDASAIARADDEALSADNAAPSMTRTVNGFVAASDELAGDKSNKLRWFPSIDGQSVESSLNDQALWNEGVTHQKKELDIEAAAAIRDTIYWIGSLGTNKFGDPAPSRQCLFTTNYKGELMRPCLGGLKEAVCRALGTPEGDECNRLDVIVHPPVENAELLAGNRIPSECNERVEGESEGARTTVKTAGGGGRAALLDAR